MELPGAIPENSEELPKIVYNTALAVDPHINVARRRDEATKLKLHLTELDPPVNPKTEN